jgi:hypothetical protein
MAFSAVFVPIVYSHDLSELRPSNRGRPRHARRSASCRASSASWTECLHADQAMTGSPATVN